MPACWLKLTVSYDGRAYAGTAQRNALFEAGHGESVCIRECEGGGNEAVAIGIGLDHGPDLGVGGRVEDARPVVVQGFGVGGGEERWAGGELPVRPGSV